MDRGQGRAAAVHRLAARVQPHDLVRPLRRCRGGLLGLAAAGHGGGVDRAPGLVRRPEAAGARELRVRGLQMPSTPRSPQLRRAYGADMAQWQWGRAHVAEFANPVFSRIPVLRDWLDVSIPTSGGVRHAQPRPEHDPRRCPALRAALRRRAADHHRPGGAATTRE